MSHGSDLEFRMMRARLLTFAAIVLAAILVLFGLAVAHGAEIGKGIWPPDDYPRAYVAFVQAFAGCRLIERYDPAVPAHWITAVACKR